MSISVETIAIGCRLPMGMILNYPVKLENREANADQQMRGKKLSLRGANRSTRVIATNSPEIVLTNHDYGVTIVPKEDWKLIKEFYGKNFKPFTSGTIFEGKNADELALKAREYVDGKVTTGFEGLAKKGDSRLAPEIKNKIEETDEK